MSLIWKNLTPAFPNRISFLMMFDVVFHVANVTYAGNCYIVWSASLFVTVLFHIHTDKQDLE